MILGCYALLSSFLLAHGMKPAPYGLGALGTRRRHQASRISHIVVALASISTSGIPGQILSPLAQKISYLPSARDIDDKRFSQDQAFCTANCDTLIYREPIIGDRRLFFRFDFCQSRIGGGVLRTSAVQYCLVCGGIGEF